MIRCGVLSKFMGGAMKFIRGAKKINVEGVIRLKSAGNAVISVKNDLQ